MTPKRKPGTELVNSVYFTQKSLSSNINLAIDC